MKLKISQNSTGRFNLLGNEISRSFSMGIFDDDGEILIAEDGKTKASLHWSGDPDDDPWLFEDLENVPDIIQRCWEYCSSIISSTNYKGNLIFFGKMYQENFDELSETYQKDKITKLEKQLAEAKESGLNDASWQINNCLDTRINQLTKWSRSQNDSLKDLKKNTETYKFALGRIDKYQSEIDGLDESRVKYYTDYEIENEKN